MKFCHVCIVAKDWAKLSQFYQDVFECRPIDPHRYSDGEGASRLINHEGGVIEGEHVMVPGYGDEGPTLEILSLNPKGGEGVQNAYDFGFTHICFEMADNRPVIEKFLAHGGTILSNYEDPLNERVVYCKDPEGNIVEIRRPNPVPDTLRVTNK